MSTIVDLACPTCLDGSLTEHYDHSGSILLCNYCTAQYDPQTLERSPL